ncbi:ModE molybdate transport repressor domain-containing protein [Promicromonospora umidemergens]|uniref:LysR family transcriptional regulator n=1 Tax=Promicromonospora umidemergens TaxID=629679 RepID=A0ABP8WD18_9MICO|nr:LysR family transcriptional regulator [Promicromonospora umidemergens]MCP2285925.1 ModE molybdate transport repressor domain-containing protein [Promicromonospora umidemergens]
MDLPSLRLLSAIAEVGSITAASRTLGITQQAASTRMRRLERQLGVTLLVRGPRGSSLTLDGTMAAQWAAETVEAADRFDAGVAALRVAEHAKPLAIAASLTVAEYLLPRWLMTLRGRDHAEHAVSVTATNSTHAIELVTDRSHQLGFVETPTEIPGLLTTTVAKDELVVVVAPQHPWARRRGVSAAELARTPLVTREKGSGTRLSAEQILADAGHEIPDPLAELPTTAAVRTAVASGAAPAVLSILAVRDDLTAGRLVRVPVKGLRFVRELRAIRSPGGAPLPQLESLLSIAARNG